MGGLITVEIESTLDQTGSTGPGSPGAGPAPGPSAARLSCLGGGRRGHLQLEHPLHVLDLVPGELLELGVGVEDLGAAPRLLLPLVQRFSPAQHGGQLRVRGAELLIRTVLRPGHVHVHGHGLRGSFLDLQPVAELGREFVCGHVGSGGAKAAKAASRGGVDAPALPPSARAAKLF